MKILELTRSFYPSIGGMEKFVSDRLKIYEKLDYNYQVITTTHSEKQIFDAKKLKNVLYLPSYSPYEIVPQLKKAMSQKYDVLSVNQVGYGYSTKAIKLAKADKKKIILTPHFYFHTERYKLIKDLHFKFVVPKILKAVDKIICFTQVEANFWKNNFPFVENKLFIIPHYFDPPKFINKNVENKSDKFLLFIGRGEVNKRIDLLIKSFGKIKTDYRLIMTISEHELSQEVINIVKRNKKIDLLGRISEKEKQNLLSSCQALILPTEYEAFGIVNFEASYYKKPLLLSNISIFNDILKKEGVIYFDNNVKSIGIAIKKILDLSDNEKQRMGEINFKNLQNYTFNKIANKYLELFIN